MNFTKIKETREQITQLLKERPGLIKYQQEIDEALAKAGKNPHNRLTVLKTMLQDNIKKLDKAKTDLSKSMEKLTKYAKSKKNNN